MTQLANVRNVVTREDPSSVSRYAASVPTGEPHTTHTGFSVVSAASTRSRASRSLIGGNGPVIGQTSTPTAGSARIASMIFRPRSSPTGWPPLSTGLVTSRYSGIHWCSARRVRSPRAGSRSPATVARSAKCAPVPPEIEYTATPSASGGRARASRVEVSWSWSSPSTRITPYCRIAASTTWSAPVSLPVCEAAVRAPAAVRPTLTATTGTPRRAARSAASRKARPSLSPST